MKDEVKGLLAYFGLADVLPLLAGDSDCSDSERLTWRPAALY